MQVWYDDGPKQVKAVQFHCGPNSDTINNSSVIFGRTRPHLPDLVLPGVGNVGGNLWKKEYIKSMIYPRDKQPFARLVAVADDKVRALGIWPTGSDPNLAYGAVQGGNWKHLDCLKQGGGRLIGARLRHGNEIDGIRAICQKPGKPNIR